MATDYLGTHAAASVPGIRLICKYIVSNGSARRSRLQIALRPHNLIRKSDGEGSTMPASLAVAKDIGLLATDDDRDAVWSPGPGLKGVESVLTVLETGDAFRPLILREVSRKALQRVTGLESPSDLSLALTWALGRDPLLPLPWDYGAAEVMLRAEGMSAIIENSTQWGAFRRWLIALGLGVSNRAPGGKRILFVSTASAIHDAEIGTPQPVSARVFVNSLVNSVPVLGHELLVAQLSAEAQRAWESTVSPGLAQGLLELGAMGELKMLPGDDSENMMRLAVGGESRTVRSIEWLRGEW